MIHFEGFDAKSWHRLVTLVAPGLASRAPFEQPSRAREPGGLLVLVWRGTDVVAAVHSHRGHCAIDRWEGESSMAALAERTDARFVLALEEGALELLLDRWGARVDPDEPAREAWLLMLDAVREVVDERRLLFWPGLVPGGVPRPTKAVLDGVGELLLPSGRAAYALLFTDEGALDTALVLARGPGGVFSVLGPERILAAVGSLTGDARRDGPVVRAWIERDLGAAHFGLHTRSSTLSTLLRSEQAGAWSRAFNEGLVRIDPSPPWVVAALGADVALSALSAARGALGSLFERVAPALESATRVAAGRATVSGLLGFDLGAVLGSVLRRSSPAATRPSDDEESD